MVAPLYQINKPPRGHDYAPRDDAVGDNDDERIKQTPRDANTRRERTPSDQTTSGPTISLTDATTRCKVTTTPILMSGYAIDHNNKRTQTSSRVRQQMRRGSPRV